MHTLRSGGTGRIPSSDLEERPHAARHGMISTSSGSSVIDGHKQILWLLVAGVCSSFVGCGGDVVGQTSIVRAGPGPGTRTDGSVLDANSPGTGGSTGLADAGSSGGARVDSSFDGRPIPADPSLCTCSRDGFFVEVRGDGDPLVLQYEGRQATSWCRGVFGPNVPRGTAEEACGSINVEFSACAMRTEGWPCLDIWMNANGWGTYTDRDGRSWNVIKFDFRPEAVADAAFEIRGTYTALVFVGGQEVEISGSVYVCGKLVQTLAPCH